MTKTTNTHVIMRKVLLFLVAMATTVCAFAQTENATKGNDPLDLSRELEKIAEYGVPTVQLVEQMKVKADNLYQAQSWSDAIVAYEEYAQTANWLANILSQCVEPYYSASYDDKQNISYAVIKKYIPYETASNNYKKFRNQAYVRIGLCYKHLGDNDKAVAYLYKGLDLVNLYAQDDWSEAVAALSEIVGFTTEQ